MISFLCRQDCPQTMSVLTNGYKKEPDYDQTAINKLLSVVLITFTDGFAYNKGMAKIRKRYNQVPHLTQDTIWESNKIQ